MLSKTVKNRHSINKPTRDLYNLIEKNLTSYQPNLKTLDSLLSVGAPLSRVTEESDEIHPIGKLELLSFINPDVLDHILQKRISSFSIQERYTLQSLMVDSIKYNNLKQFDVLIKYVKPDFAFNVNDEKFKKPFYSFLSFAIKMFEPTPDNIKRIEQILNTNSSHPNYISMYGDFALKDVKNLEIKKLVLHSQAQARAQATQINNNKMKIIYDIDELISYYQQHFIHPHVYAYYYMTDKEADIVTRSLQYTPIDMCVKCFPTQTWVEKQNAYLQSLNELDIHTIKFYTSKGDQLLNTLIRKKILIKDDFISKISYLEPYFKEYAFNISNTETNNEKMEVFLWKIVKRLDRIINNAPKLDKPLVLHRGQKTVTYVDGDITYLTMGVLSTSISYNIAHNFGRLIYTFFIPTHIPVLYIESISTLPFEMEVLLPSQVCFDYINSVGSEIFLKFKKIGNCE